MVGVEKSMLRFATTGSVDDGKSTLIGRLLYETKSIYEDQYAAIEKTSKRKGLADVDLALLLDGLAAEREQGITIDVAYRYFETANRKFIIADTPGHVQYTRNMVTGASTAECAIILIDARNGVLTQSKRHGFIASLLQIPRIIVAVNKMDLVEYSEGVFQTIVEEYREFSEKLDVYDTVFIPVSALKGDNVVAKSRNMPWYDGVTLLHYLENIHVSADRNLVDFRFPVQHVIRPHSDFRGFAGRIVSGTVSPGEEIVILPSAQTTRIREIITYDGALQEAFCPQSVVLTLDDEVDVSRGDMIVRRNNIPTVGDSFEAIICWMDERQLSRRTPYFLKHTTRQVKATIDKVYYKIDMNTLHREVADEFGMNEVGKVEIHTSQPVFFDIYRSNRATGSFILIDPLSNNTVAAGVMRGIARSIEDIAKESRNVEILGQRVPSTIWHGWNIAREEREMRNKHKAAIVWLTGYSGSGKSTIARTVERKLYDMGCHTILLEGDHLRRGLCKDLGFSDKDRNENIRRAGEVAKLFYESGHIVFCAFISPFRSDRQFVRGMLDEGGFVEVYVKCGLDVCMRRDPNGFYRRAMKRDIKDFTGIDSRYEEPQNPEILIETDADDVTSCARLLLNYIKAHFIQNE